MKKLPILFVISVMALTISCNKETADEFTKNSNGTQDNTVVVPIPNPIEYLSTTIVIDGLLIDGFIEWLPDESFIPFYETHNYVRVFEKNGKKISVYNFDVIELDALQNGGDEEKKCDRIYMLVTNDCPISTGKQCKVEYPNGPFEDFVIITC